MVSVTLQSLWHVTKVFVAVKAVLFLILYFQFSEYDTSSALLFPSETQSSNVGFFQGMAKRLCIWDTVFHVTAAMREGTPYYEHEWAFGICWSWVIRQSGKTLIHLLDHNPDPEKVIYYYVAGATIVSTLSHYLACVVLYFLTIEIFSQTKSPLIEDLVQQARPQGSQEVPVATKKEQEEESKQRAREQKKVSMNAERIARKTATLYALTPAGVFMSAGYSEPLFALISFIGMYVREKQFYALAGCFFGVATLLRSNGLLWGLVFLGDLGKIINGFYKSCTTPGKQALRGVFIATGLQVIVGGMMIGFAFVGVQYYAYTLYCLGYSTAEWCEKTVPLIYSHVQNKYWGMGFLRYWTPNNIPNFLFAFPTLAIMWKSGCHYSYYLPKSVKDKTDTPDFGESERQVFRKIEYLSPYLNVQLVMFFACLATWHVQIITRVGSCLPVVYWYTAEMLLSTQLSEVKTGKVIVRYFMTWIVVQGIFFSAFLPPA